MMRYISKVKSLSRFLSRVRIAAEPNGHEHEMEERHSHGQPDIKHQRSFKPEELSWLFWGDDEPGQITGKAAPLLAKPKESLDGTNGSEDHSGDLKQIRKIVQEQFKEIKEAIEAYMKPRGTIEQKIKRRTARLEKDTDPEDQKSLKEDIESLKKEIEKLDGKFAKGSHLAHIYQAKELDPKDATSDSEALQEISEHSEPGEKFNTASRVLVVDRAKILKTLLGGVFKEHPEWFHVRLTTGNTKLANEGIAAFSLPEVYTCPGAGDCKKYCYARYGLMLLPDSLLKRWVNYYAVGADGSFAGSDARKAKFKDEAKALISNMARTKKVKAEDLYTTSSYKIKKTDKTKADGTAGKEVKLEEFDKLKASKEKAIEEAQKARDQMVHALENELKKLKDELKADKIMSDKAKKDKKAKLEKEIDGKVEEVTDRLEKAKDELEDLKEMHVDVHPLQKKDGKDVEWAWDALRIHDAGDFFDPDYIESWIDIIKHFPDLKFYAYTKIYGVSHFKGKPLRAAYEKLLKQPNFKIIQSQGSLNDGEMDAHLPKAIVFKNGQDAKDAGCEYASESDRAALHSKNLHIGLFAHGAGASAFNYKQHGALPDHVKTTIIDNWMKNKGHGLGFSLSHKGKGWELSFQGKKAGSFESVSDLYSYIREMPETKEYEHKALKPVDPEKKPEAPKEQTWVKPKVKLTPVNRIPVRKKA